MWNRNSTVQQRTHELHHLISLIVALNATAPGHTFIDEYMRTLNSMDQDIGRQMHQAITYNDHGGPLQLMMTLRDQDKQHLTGAWNQRGEDAA